MGLFENALEKEFADVLKMQKIITHLWYFWKTKKVKNFFNV